MSSAQNIPITAKNAAESEKQLPENIPAKLVKRYNKLENNTRALARDRGVNPSYISDLFNHGKEPTNMDVRKKLYFTKKYRKPVPNWVKQGASFLEKNQQNRAIYKKGGEKI